MAAAPAVSLVKAPGLILLALTTLALLVVALRAIVHPLRRIPGPFFARLTRLWYLTKIWKGDFQETNIALHEKYGPVVRIAPNEYSLNSPEAIRAIYGHGTHFAKAPWYLASAPVGQESEGLFTELDAKRHAANRRKVASLYSMTNMLKWEQCVDKSTQVLISQFKRHAESAKPINLQLWLQYFAFDTMSLITLGKSFGLVERGRDDHGFLEALHAYLVYSANVGVYSEFHPFFGRLVDMLPSKGIAWVADFVQRQLHQRIDEIGPKNFASAPENDFLDTILRMHGQDPDKIRLQDCFRYSMTNIGAGSDTTSVSLASIMYHVITSPHCLQKVRQELDEAAKRGQLSELITFSESQQLPFLQACIKEGLRMHPATGLPLARVVPKGGVIIHETLFPAGTVVGVNSWVAHANKDVFGPDADQFRPDRWLESKERSSNMERSFLAFGAGSRTCIGKNISMMEISKAIPELIRRFEFTLESPNTKIEMENVWFVKQKNLNCHISTRQTEGIMNVVQDSFKS